MFDRYDVIVVGGGHAGCEAAAAAAHMGAKVLLATMNMNTIAQMSCNPAMGGVAKGQIVRELDALGGYSGIVADETMIQFRMLNKSKGPAMWSPRVQSDRMRFAEKWRMILERTENIDFWQEMVTGIIVKNGEIKGIKTGLGLEIPAKKVILTNGTFLNGIIHIGQKQFGGGRAGERASTGITEQLVELGFEAGRMKTGTPPRVDGRTLDYEAMEVQHGDKEITGFSFTDTQKPETQRPCHITYTSPKVHDILREGFSDSPMFNGRIKGMGPRYCPSIEDKIDRFSDRDRHQLFVEPEGWNTVEVYVNGFSSSLSEEVQYEALRRVPGFEKCKMFRPGYAIEYDFFQPTQLSITLETHLVNGLYFAGQINGTTGYEEAGAQGYIAGVNAVLAIRDEEPFVLRRDQAYMGVLVDDLVHKGTKEPYRMFTSRAEYRIMLRQDNADQRLTPIAHKVGMQNMEDRISRLNEKQESINEIVSYISNTSVSPQEVNKVLEENNSSQLSQSVKLKSILLRPQIDLNILSSVLPETKEFLDKFNEETRHAAEVEIVYEGYIKREKEMAEKVMRLEDVKLHASLDYKDMKALSKEAREKLNKHKPMTVGQASRISGVSPADVSVLLIHMGR